MTGRVSSDIRGYFSIFAAALQPRFNAAPAPGLQLTHYRCQACLDDNINDPVCQPFGTRQLLRCSQRDAPKEDSILAWHACGRLASEEKKGFLKFVVSGLPLWLQR